MCAREREIFFYFFFILSRFRLKKLRFDTQMRRADGGERAAGALPHDADPTDSKRRGIRGGFGVGFSEVWGWFWRGLDGDGVSEVVKKCKKNAKKCKIICIYQIFFVPLQRVWE